MGLLGDVLGFDAFALKDIWKSVKKDPERLLIGAVDPLSTKMWNGILGKDYEPLVDQMGGPYGGHTISAFGNNEGGVYKRAQDAGINTESGAGAHDAAHTIAAIFGAQGLMGAGQGLLGGGQATGSNLGVFSNGGVNGMTGVGGGNAGALAQSGAISNGAGTASLGNGLTNAMDMGKQLGFGGQQQPQQQAMPAPAPQRGNNQALMAQLQRQQRAQALRRKINRTPQENQELRELTQGLLG
jgi:hypothetical protein